MLRNLFNPDSGLMIVMGQITDVIFLSLFWLVGCVPLVTMGASSAALYDAVARGLRRGDKHTWNRFFSAFRSNWKAGIGPSAVGWCVFALLALGERELWNAAVAQGLSWGVFAAGTVLVVLALGMLSILFPVLSRFQNSFGGLLKNTVLLGLAHLPRTLCLGLLHAAEAYLCLRYILPVFLLPTITALLSSFLLEPVFRPYMGEQPLEE